jgi:hypothetical protein
MALIILVRIAIEYQRYLSSEARSILRGKLLTQLGPYDDGQLTLGVQLSGDREPHSDDRSVALSDHTLLGSTTRLNFSRSKCWTNLGNDFHESVRARRREAAANRDKAIDVRCRAARLRPRTQHVFH